MQQYTFYDLIITKARGKSGPLFSWDVHEDVRVLADASREKDEVSCSCFLAVQQNRLFIILLSLGLVSCW
jgi:hypothetical protein